MEKKENKIKNINQELKKIERSINNPEYECVICNTKLVIDGKLIRCKNEKLHKNEVKLMKKLERQKVRIVKENERINKKHDRIEERLSKMKVKVEVDKKTKAF